jgi:FkbM family methyltransferase
MMSAAKALIRRCVGAFGRSSVGAPLMRMGAGTLMERQHVVIHDGLRLAFVVPNEMNVYRIETFSQKEPETLHWIDSFDSGAVFWDIGANVGLYSCYAAKRSGCQVFAFEPSVFNLELLARNVFINELSGRVTLVSLPLSESLANSTLNMSSTEWGGAMSTFDKSYSHDGAELRKVFEFRTIGISMDEAVERLGVAQPDYIKMDVDGIEHLILKGGARVLSKTRSVLIEINEEFEKQAVDAARHLAAAGLVLKEKRRSEIFDDTVYRNCYNQIWHRPQAS